MVETSDTSEEDWKQWWKMAAAQTQTLLTSASNWEGWKKDNGAAARVQSKRMGPGPCAPPKFSSMSHLSPLRRRHQRTGSGP